MYRDGIRFSCFVCVAINESQLSNHLKHCLDAQTIKRFYTSTAIMSDEKLRDQFFHYLDPLTRLPFALKLS